MSSHRVDDPQIREEVELLVRRMQAELESLLVGPGESKAFAAVAASIVPVQYGFLRMGCEDGAALADEMEGLAGELGRAAISDPEAGRDALLRAAVETEQYLEWLRRGQRQQPFDLLPLINQIRELRGLPLAAGHRIRVTDFPGTGVRRIHP